jgi:hypothetical protein
MEVLKELRYCENDLQHGLATEFLHRFRFDMTAILTKLLAELENA